MTYLREFDPAWVYRSEAECTHCGGQMRGTYCDGDEACPYACPECHGKREVPDPDDAEGGMLECGECRE